MPLPHLQDVGVEIAMSHQEIFKFLVVKWLRPRLTDLQVASPKDFCQRSTDFEVFKASPYYFGKKFAEFWLIFSKMLRSLTKPNFLNSKALELVS